MADTDGSELKVAENPPKLTIQLGQEWAGKEFELRTDAGLYPGIVKVNSSGVLEMELSDSSFFTLSCVHASMMESKVENVEEETREMAEPEKDIEEKGEKDGFVVAIIAMVAIVSVVFICFYRKMKKH